MFNFLNTEAGSAVMRGYIDMVRIIGEITCNDHVLMSSLVNVAMETRGFLPGHLMVKCR